MKMRRIISLTMLLSFLAMSYTGIMLFLAPHGRVAYWTGWRLLGLSKEQYGELHTTFMIVFLAAGIWHLVNNWNPVKSYLKNRSRQVRVFTREFNVALLLSLLFTAGTLAGWAPWSSLLDWEGSIKDTWEHRDGSPPWGHAEENSLSRFVRGLVDWERLEHQREVRLPLDRAMAALREAGIEGVEAERPLIDIANENRTTPQALMAILREAELPLEAGEAAVEPARPGGGTFPMPYSGLGRMTLEFYCEKYGADQARILELLPETADAGGKRTFRELADAMGTDPEGVVEFLNARVSE